jgi:PIN domain nuclease of toxin-antitoxin system
MKYLLDTHVLLWVMSGSSRLSGTAKSIILNPEISKHVSIVSAWEVALKLGTRKLSIDGGLPELFRMIDENGFATLGVEREHIGQLGALPPIHRDPFDRILIATALAEGLILVTADENIQRYDVQSVW